MLHDIVQKGATDRSVTLRIIDSTDGTPETGVVYNTAGIDLWYRREGAAKVSITEATLSALTDAHSDGGVLHIGDGYYRLDLPDAAFASGANSVDFGGAVTGMVVIGGRVRLVNLNLEDAVRAGLTALPNANAEAAGGLFTRGSGAGQINQAANGQIDVNVAAMADAVLTAAKIAADAIGASELAADAVTEIATAIWAAATRTLTANPGLDAAGVRAAVGMASANLDTQIATLATAANLATVAGYLDTEIAAILADTNELQTDWANGGRLDNILDARASQASVDTVDGVVDAILVDTAEIGAAGAGLTALASASALATVDTVVDAIQAKTDNLPSDPADQSLVIAATDAVMTRLGAPAGASLSADVAAVKAQTAAIEVDTQDLQAQVGVDGAGLTAVPWNAAWDAEVQSEAADALAAYDGPTKAELDAAVAPLATSAALAAVDGNVDLVLEDTGTTLPGTLATIAGYIDTEVAAVKAVTDKLDTALELDGSVYRYTVNALEQAPSGGGGGSTDWTSDEREQIRHRLGIDGTADAPSATPSLASAAALATVDTVVDAIQAKTDGLPSDPADQSLVIAATDAVMARLGAPAGASVSADIAAVKTQTAAIEVDTQDLQAQVGVDGAGLTAVPWNAAWDAEVQSEAADALAAYDPPTKAELDAAVAPLATSAALATVDGNVNLVLEDTGTTLPGTLATIAGYVDTEVAAIKAKTDLIPAAPAAVGDIPTAAAIADAVHDEVVEGTTTLRQSVRLANAALGGKASGLETTEATFRDLADTKDRIVATVDADGNRTAVTRDLS